MQHLDENLSTLFYGNQFTREKPKINMSLVLPNLLKSVFLDPKSGEMLQSPTTTVGQLVPETKD